MIKLAVVNPSNGHICAEAIVNSTKQTLDLLKIDFGLIEAGTERTARRGVTRLYSPSKHLYLDVSRPADGLSEIAAMLK